MDADSKPRWLLLWAGYVMMRYGCGAHMMGVTAATTRAGTAMRHRVAA